MDDGLYKHATLGEFYFEDWVWETDQATVPFCDHPIAVCLAGEEDNGPSDDAIAGYEWIVSNWPGVLKIMSDQAFDFYRPYVDAEASVPKFDSPDALWGTERLMSIYINSKDDFTVTMYFDWQKEHDTHEITFYIEQGKCLAHSVDG